jgi:8-oxo-dGTP diphosphatase
MAEEIVVGVVGVLFRGNGCLVVRRAEGIAAGGQWCFPGGAVEAGETAAQAIEREMLEEVGLAVHAQREVWRWQSPESNLELRWWLVQEQGAGVLRLHSPEIADAAWIAPDEIARLDPLIDGNRLFLEEVLSGRLSLDEVNR